MGTIRLRTEESDDRVSPGDTVEYGLSMPLGTKRHSPWVTVRATLAVREGESEDEFMERLCGLVHESYDAQADGLSHG